MFEDLGLITDSVDCKPFVAKIYTGLNKFM